MKAHVVFAIAALSALLYSSCAFAWGVEGHEVVGLIAEHYLQPAVRKQVDEILARDGSGLIVHRTLDLIADETIWADKYRDDPSHPAQHAATMNWHFADLELDHADMSTACFGRPALPQGTAAVSGPPRDCIVDKIEQFRTELSNKQTSPEEQLRAVQFLLHLIGDIHQPLHAADDHDRGGSDKTVSVNGEEPVKLHRVWDTVLVEKLGTDPEVVARQLIAKITPAEVWSWQQGTPEQWALESYQLAKQFAYGHLPARQSNGDYQLDTSYVSGGEPIVADQLSKAGVRLAFVLNNAFR
jgi:hypothetical protein